MYKLVNKKLQIILVKNYITANLSETRSIQHVGQQICVKMQGDGPTIEIFILIFLHCYRTVKFSIMYHFIEQLDTIVRCCLYGLLMIYRFCIASDIRDISTQITTKSEPIKMCRQALGKSANNVKNNL